MKMNNWENSFHHTYAKSTLTEKDIDDIEYSKYAGCADKVDLKQVSRLLAALCGHKNCGCSVFNKIVE